MKYLKMILFSFLFVFALSYVIIGSDFVSADDDFEEKYEYHEEDENDKDSL